MDNEKQPASLRIIGTSHISRQSIDEISQAFGQMRPDIVALELDPQRLAALTSKTPRSAPSLAIIRMVGIKGFIFSFVGQWVQQKLGEQVGVKPGSEMRAAIRLARRDKIRIALIDQDIQVTLQRLSMVLTWKEKGRILWDIIAGLLFPQRQAEKIGVGSIDLSKVPEKKIIRLLMGQVRERYPGIYQVLVEERNIFMARMLARLIQQNPGKKILAVVGAGHEEELAALVSQYTQDTLSYSFEVTG